MSFEKADRTCSISIEMELLDISEMQKRKFYADQLKNLSWPIRTKPIVLLARMLSNWWSVLFPRWQSSNFVTRFPVPLYGIVKLCQDFFIRLPITTNKIELLTFNSVNQRKHKWIEKIWYSYLTALFHYEFDLWETIWQKLLPDKLGVSMWNRKLEKIFLHWRNKTNQFKIEICLVFFLSRNLSCLPYNKHTTFLQQNTTFSCLF